MVLYDTIIVGSSAAGLTAALYAARQGLKTLVITKDVGGQMLLTNDIQNYPGFTQIGGFDLANKLKKQAELYGAEFIYDEVTGIDEDKECPGLCFKVRTNSSQSTADGEPSPSYYSATTVILAFGKTPKDLGVEGEQRLKGKGVSYCAVCDGPLFRGKTVAVVGTGDQALEAANYLSNVVAKVYLIHNYDNPIGSEEMIDQVRNLPNVEFVPNAQVSSLDGDQKLEKVVVKNTRTGASSNSKEINADGIFVEIGYTPKTEFLRRLVKLTDRGEIEVDRDGKTTTDGIFAAGDVSNGSYKQAVISAGQGATVALSAYNHVQRLKGKAAAKADWRSIKPVLLR